MKMAVIGGGFTGLTAAYELGKAGHRVTLLEKEAVLGGLAHGFREPGWEWYLEKFYHHWFTNDLSILRLLSDLGLKNKLLIRCPVTANFWRGKAYQFDNVIDFLRYPGLTSVDKLRTGALLAFLKSNPFWQPLESVTAEKLARLIGGDSAWKALWEPLMVAKFGNYANKVAASWFWARIKKRTPSLGYIEGGFQTLVAALEKAIKVGGGKIFTETTVPRIERQHSGFSILNSQFDEVLLTVPTPIALKLVPNLSFGIGHLALTIPHLHAQTLILETKEPILKGVYWLNILDRQFPFLAVVAHTNFIDSKYYAGHHLTYFGNYLPKGHPYLSLTKKQLLKVFLPFIKRLNPSCQLSAVSCQLFTGPYAQPVHLLHYSQLAPRLKTSFPGIYLANLDSIYPWDRGTNYAIELGQKAARLIMKEAK